MTLGLTLPHHTPRFPQLLRSSAIAFASLGLAAVALAGVSAGNSEAEPNESKATATLAASGGPGMSPGDFLTGTTTGTLTNPGSGSPSADYFRVRTAPASFAIYRHRLIITTSGLAGHTGTIRGLSQSDGTIAQTSDITFQTSSPATSPARFNQWYGFGRQEELFYRITGSASTAGTYFVTLTSDPVTPTTVATPVIAGAVTIANDLDAGNFADTDYWLYDAQGNAIANAGNDGQNTLTRTLAPGTYLLAVSNFNTANNLPSPPDDSFRSGNVLDFPDAIANGSVTTFANLAVRITHAGGSISVPASKPGPYDIAWIRFTVAAGNNPTGVGSASPQTVAQGASTLLAVAVTPGSSPPSTGLAVAVNASAIGLGASLTLLDDGLNGDLAANDGTFSRSITIPAQTPLNDYALPFSVTDAQGRSASGSILLTVIEPPPPNDLCTAPTLITPQMLGLPIPGTTVGCAPSFDASGPCGGSADTRDVFYSLTPAVSGFWAIDTCSTPGLDTVVSVHAACPTVGQPSLVDGQSCQDSTCGTLSGGARTFAPLLAGSTYIIRVATKEPFTGNFTLVVTPASPPPANDTCAGAVNAAGAPEIPFNNAGATTNPESPANPGCAGPVAADVWFRWSPPEVIGNGTWRMTVSSGARAALWPDACPPSPGSQIGCAEGAGSVLFPAPPGSTFLIQAGGSASTPLVGDASVLFTFIPNTGLCCAGQPATLSIRSQADCQSAGGTYQGDNTAGGFTADGLIIPSAASNLPIPDNNPVGLSDSIALNTPGVIDHLALRLSISHTFVGDLVCTLSNGSTTVTIFNRVGRVVSGFGSAADLAEPLRFHDTAPNDLWQTAATGLIPAGDYRPSAASNAPAALADFRGQPIAGTWTLTVADLSLSDAGALVTWALEFNPPTVCGGGTPTCLADFDGNGIIDPDDLADFIAGFFTDPPDPRCDANLDGTVDPDDLADFIAAFFGPPC